MSDRDLPEFTSGELDSEAEAWLNSEPMPECPDMCPGTRPERIYQSVEKGLLKNQLLGIVLGALKDRSGAAKTSSATTPAEN